MKKEKTKLRVIQILCIVSLLITVFSIQRTYAKYFEKVDTTYATNIKRWVIKIDGTKIHELGEDELSQVMQPAFRENEHMSSNNTLVPGREGYFPFEIDYSSVDLAFRFEFDIQQLNKNTIVDEDTNEETVVDAHLEDFEMYGFEIVDGSNTYTTEITGLSMISPIIDPVEGSITYAKIITATESELQSLQVLQVLEELEDGSKKVVVQDKKTLDTDKIVELRPLFRWNDANKDTTDANEVAGMNNYEDTAFVGEENANDPARDLLKYNVKVTFTQQL